MLSIFKPAAHKARLPAAEIDPLYRRLRWQIFIGIFLVMPPTIWFVRTLPSAMPYLIEQGFSRGDLGFAPFRYLHRLWIFEIHHGIGL